MIIYILDYHMKIIQRRKFYSDSSESVESELNHPSEIIFHLISPIPKSF